MFVVDKTNVLLYNDDILIIGGEISVQQTTKGGELEMAKPIKPGTDNQRPGRYVEVGPRGGQVNNPRVVNIGPGDRLPPTQEPGRGWQKK